MLESRNQHQKSEECWDVQSEMRISEIRHRRLFEAARDGILILDAMTRKITDANHFIVELLDYSREEFLGKELWEIGLLKDAAASENAYRELETNGYIRYENLPLQTKSGQRREVEFISNLYTENGHQVIQCDIRDISERKRASDIERESHHLLQGTLDALSSHIAVLDKTGKIIAVNQAWRQFSEVNHGTAVSCGVGVNYIEVCNNVRDFWSKEARAVALGIEEVRAGRQHMFCLEYPCHSPAEERWFNVCITRFSSYEPGYVVVAHENITERKTVQATLLQSEARFRTAIEEAPLPIMIHREDGKVLQLSEGWTQYSGYEIEDIPTIHDWARRAYGKSSDEAQEYINELYQLQETRIEGEWTICAKSGEERIWDFRSTPLGTFGDNKRIVISAALDTTERKQAEDAMRWSELRYRSLLKATSAIVWATAASGEFETEQPGWSAFTGQTYGHH